MYALARSIVNAGKGQETEDDVFQADCSLDEYLKD